jgi:hypothetical protein
MDGECGRSWGETGRTLHAQAIGFAAPSGAEERRGSSDDDPSRRRRVHLKRASIRTLLVSVLLLYAVPSNSARS